MWDRYIFKKINTNVWGNNEIDIKENYHENGFKKKIAFTNEQSKGLQKGLKYISEVQHTVIETFLPPRGPYQPEEYTHGHAMKMTLQLLSVWESQGWWLRWE